MASKVELLRVARDLFCKAVQDWPMDRKVHEGLDAIDGLISEAEKEELRAITKGEASR